MQAGDGSSVVAGSRPRTRTCLGCAGSGCVADRLPDSHIIVGLAGCPACLGSGTVTDRMGFMRDGLFVPDAVADAKQFRPQWEQSRMRGWCDFQASEALECIEKGWPASAGHRASRAAHDAFVEIPALKADDAPRRPEQPSLADGLDRHRFGPRGLLIVSVLLALTFGARPAAAGDRTTAYALHCSMKAADLASTEIAFSKNPAAYETNPMPGMQSTAGRAAWGLGTCAVAAEMDRKLAKHPKGRWAFRIIGLGLLGYAVQNNARIAARGGAR